MTARLRPTFPDGGIFTEDEGEATAAGWNAYKEATAVQDSIVGETTLTNMSQVVTVDANRLILVLVKGRVNVSDSGAGGVGWIYRDSTRLGEWCSYVAQSANDERFTAGWAFDSPGAGTYTYSATLLRSTGTGSVGLEADPNESGQLLVVDLGSL